MCSAVTGCKHTFLNLTDWLAVSQILSSKLCNSDQMICDAIAALNETSKAVVEVRNTGVVTATFTATLGSCTYPNIAVSQSFSLLPDETSERVLEVLPLHQLLACTATSVL